MRLAPLRPWGPKTSWLAVAVQATALAAAACAPLAGDPVKQQIVSGRQTYEQGCATERCHGTQGEGIREVDKFRVWPTVGQEFQRRNPTAQVVFDVVRSGGESSLRALTDQQIYDAIAYELSLNDVNLAEPLDVANAPAVSTGAAAADFMPGLLFPPPANAELIKAWAAPSLPAQAENSELRIRLTQIGRARSVGRTAAPAGSTFVFVVLTFEVLGKAPVEVGPDRLRIRTDDGTLLRPLEIGLAFPVDRFHAQTIEPHFGTSAVVAFSPADTQQIQSLVYALPSGGELVIGLEP